LFFCWLYQIWSPIFWLLYILFWFLGKFDLIFRKIFSFYFGRKTLSISCKKFKNILLFVDYIKFDHQSFDCYIFCFEFFFESFFQFLPLKFNLIWFMYQLWSLFFNCYLFFSYHFFYWNFLSIIFGLHFLITIYFI